MAQPAPGRERRRSVSTDQMRALAHARQAQAAPPCGSGRVEPLTIILYHERDVVDAASQAQPHMTRMAVADGIGQALLRDAIQRRLHITGQPLIVQRRVIVRAQVEMRLDGEAFAGVAGEGAQCRWQPGVIEQRGAELVRERLHLGQCLLGQRRHTLRLAGGARVTGRAIEPPTQRLRMQGQRGQTLPDLVV